MRRRVRTTPGFWLYLLTIPFVSSLLALVVRWGYVSFDIANLVDPEDVPGAVAFLGKNGP